MTKLINGNPHWHKAWEIAEFLGAIARTFPKGKVSMWENKVRKVSDHACGTPACHGGWAALMGARKPPRTSRLNYLHGSLFIARKLGFDNDDDLSQWADKNDDLWGNTFGSCMFSSERSFGLDRDPTLHEISRHWLGVAKRLYKLQKGVEL